MRLMGFLADIKFNFGRKIIIEYRVNNDRSPRKLILIKKLLILRIKKRIF